MTRFSTSSSAVSSERRRVHRKASRRISDPGWISATGSSVTTASTRSASTVSRYFDALSANLQPITSFAFRASHPPGLLIFLLLSFFLLSFQQNKMVFRNLSTLCVVFLAQVLRKYPPPLLRRASPEIQKAVTQNFGNPARIEKLAETLITKSGGDSFAFFLCRSFIVE